MRETDETMSYPVARALCERRMQRGWSVGETARRLGVSERVLSLIEEGLRVPADDLLAEMVELYGIDLNELDRRPAAPRVAPDYNRSNAMFTIGETRVTIPDNADNATVLDLFANALRIVRELSPHQPAYVRFPELPILSTLLDLDDPELIFDAMRYLGLSWVEAGSFVESIRNAALVDQH